VTFSGKNCAGVWILVAVFLLLLLSCTSVPKDVPLNTVAKSEENSTGSDSVPLRVPDKISSSYFHDIDPEIMKDMMKGSPGSLRDAVSKLRKASIDYTEPEKVLLSIAAGVMKIAWPTESVDWEIPAVNQATAYLGAIDSAVKGVYDSSTGNTDFLTLVLPSLVLLTNESRTDYYADSETALKLSLGMASDSVLANYLLGILYRREGKLPDALQYFAAAAKQDTECLQTACAWANALSNTGQIQQASDIAQRFVNHYPDNVTVLKLCAETSFALGNFSSAELYVARVLQQNPADLGYILFRARILVEEGDYIKAASLLDVYSRSDKTSKDYLMLRARIQRDWNKNLKGAAETMNQAVSLYPDDSSILLFAAEIAASAGETVNGKTPAELVKTVLEKDPSNIAALDISIKSLVQERNWSEAYTMSSRLIKKDGIASDSIYTHIKICLALAKTSEAWSLVSSLYGKNPSDEHVLQAYLEVLFALGRRTESADLINSLLPNASSRMKSFLYYRRSFLMSGEQAVLTDLRSSLIANPRNEDALYRLYTLYYDKRDYRKAQYYLKQVVALNPSNEDYLKKNSELEGLLAR